MNTLLLLAGFCPRSRSAWSLLTRVFAAVSVVSIEMQLVTWLGIGSLRILPLINAPMAIGWLVFAHPRRQPAANSDRVRVRDAVPLAGVCSMALLVAALNLAVASEPADPYHVDKMVRIERVGTLAYDPAVDSKINVLSSVYELVLADLRQVPVIGPWLLQLHGIAGLCLFLVAIAAVRECLRAPAGWPWAMLLTIPVVFHQFVLIKNDLFVGAPAIVVLTWAMTRSATATPAEAATAIWLAAFTVAVKLTNLPLLVIVLGAVVLERRREAVPFGAIAVGTVAGLAAGGLFFMISENLRLYGELFPFAGIGGANESVAEIAVGVPRFALSLVDFGLLTRELWPGRGGWGGTFGLPFIWALVVTLTMAPRSSKARRALLFAGLYFAAFAVGFEDADLAQRLALAPGVMLTAVAVDLAVRHTELRALRLAAGPVIALSAAQILRSAWLYASTGT